MCSTFVWLEITTIYFIWTILCKLNFGFWFGISKQNYKLQTNSLFHWNNFHSYCFKLYELNFRQMNIWNKSETICFTMSNFSISVHKFGIFIFTIFESRQEKKRQKKIISYQLPFRYVTRKHLINHNIRTFRTGGRKKESNFSVISSLLNRKKDGWSNETS